ncbi:MAG TPA: hypothetical protein VEQ58_16060, partial [Polyangiaceae bacterium]|nr:hypothetical protein [Polyangiaceae bacterium]
LAVALAEFGPPRSRLSLERISGVLGAAGMSQTALETGRPYDPPTLLDAGTAASWGQTANRKSGSRRVVLIAAAVLTLGALGFVGYVVKHRDTTGPSAAASLTTVAPPVAAAPPPTATTTTTEAPHIAPLPPEPDIAKPEPEPTSKPLPTPQPQQAVAGRKPLRPGKSPAKDPPPAPVVAARPEPVAAPPPPPAPPAPKPKSTGSVFDDR